MNTVYRRFLESDPAPGGTPPPTPTPPADPPPAPTPPAEPVDHAAAIAAAEKRAETAESAAKAAFAEREAAKEAAKKAEAAMIEARDERDAQAALHARRQELQVAAAGTVDPAFVVDLLLGVEGNPVDQVAALILERPFLVGKPGQPPSPDFPAPPKPFDTAIKKLGDQIRESRPT